MSKNYVDIVSIKGMDDKQYLRTAPSWSRLEEGDEVMFQVDGHPFEIKGHVVALDTISVTDEVLKLIKTFARDVDLRVTKRITYYDFDYSQYDEPEVVEELTEAGDANG